jgi:hypothetical protein
VFDKAGNLYRASTDGGMVYQLAPPAKPGDPCTESVLYAFPGNTQGDGVTPSGGLVMDSVDNLYGANPPPGVREIACCGEYEWGCGTVYEVSPPKERVGPGRRPCRTASRLPSKVTCRMGIWCSTVQGTCTGATTFGGGKATTCDKFYAGQCGTVFELSPPRTKGDPAATSTGRRVAR